MGGLQGLRLWSANPLDKALRVAAAVFSFLPTLGFRTALSVTDQTLLHDRSFKLSNPKRTSSYK